MKHLVLISITVLLFAFSAKKPKKFPAIQATSLTGENITNDYFLGKKTVVVTIKIGCFAAMGLIDSLNHWQQSLQDTDVQVLLMFSNTASQVNSFNSNDSSIWAGMRRAYQLPPIPFPTIAACEGEDRLKRMIDGSILILSQCKDLEKTLKTRTYPSIYFVNKRGFITQKFKGYNPQTIRDMKQFLEISL